MNTSYKIICGLVIGAIILAISYPLSEAYKDYLIDTGGTVLASEIVTLSVLPWTLSIGAFLVIVFNDND